MADEAKLPRPVHSGFEALVMQCVVGCCCRVGSTLLPSAGSAV